MDGMTFHVPDVLRWNGSAWSLVASPVPGSASPAAGTVFAVGAREIPGQCCLRTLALKTTSG